MNVPVAKPKNEHSRAQTQRVSPMDTMRLSAATVVYAHKSIVWAATRLGFLAHCCQVFVICLSNKVT